MTREGVGAGHARPGRRAALAAAVVALFALAGCSTVEADSGPGPSRLKGWATPAEINWLRALATWGISFESALNQFRELAEDPTNLGGADKAQLEGRLIPVTQCAERMRLVVPSAPTPRLTRVFEDAKKACRHYARSADLLLRALRGRGAGAAWALAAAKGGRLLQRVYDMLPPGEAQPVQVVLGKSSETKIDPSYGRVADELAKSHPTRDKAEVRCWSEEDWPRLIEEEQAVSGIRVSVEVLGLTGLGGKRINLSPDACRELDRLAYDDEQPEDSVAKLMLAYGVATLAHEAQHRVGIAEEDVAECYGLQSLRDAALSLGADAGYADELAAAYWGEYPNHPAGYRSLDCRDGGKLDLHPGTGRWP